MIPAVDVVDDPSEDDRPALEHRLEACDVSKDIHEEHHRKVLRRSQR